MSASEIATVVEGWATLVGLFVVIAGALFAGIQLRQEAKARHLQAIMAVLTNIRPPEVTHAMSVLASLPEGFEFQELDPATRDAIQTVGSSYGRLGILLAEGLVKERDIFPHPYLSRGAIDAWEKVKHLTRTGSTIGGELSLGMYGELLASRAQNWLEREGVKTFGDIPFFDADPTVLQSIALEVQEARAAGS